MKTLILIDVQNDFMPGGRLAVPQADQIIPVINRIQEQFDLIVATQDWHPQNHKSFASNHHDKEPFDIIDLNGTEQIIWPDHCVQGSSGAEFHPDLKTNKIAAVFRKGMDTEIDSYSGFYDNNRKISTGLSGYLKEKGVAEVYFCGLATDICVFHTVRDSIGEGFSAILIEDASQPLDANDFAVKRNVLIQLGVCIINSCDLSRKNL